MAWNYRKRVKIAPGVHLNFSKSGVSTSIGPKGAKVTFGKNGTYLNTGIPGTGLYNRQKIGGGTTSSSNRCYDNGGDQNGMGGCFSAFGSLALIIFGAFCLGGNTITIIIGLILIIVGGIIFYTSFISGRNKTSSAEEAIEETTYLEVEQPNSVQNTSQLDTPLKTTPEGNFLFENFDPLFEDAAVTLIQNGIASTSFLQRKYAIGYNRAGHIMDQLEKIGVVGPAHGSSPRDLFINNLDEWLILKSRLLIELANKKASNTKSKSEDIDLTITNCLTEEQFNLIKSASENLCSFMTKVGRKRNVRAKLDEMLKLENNDGTPWPVTKKVQIATFADVFRCYNGLGHDFSLDDDEENIGVYLFMAKYLRPDTTITFDTVSQCKYTLKDSFTSVLETSNLINQNSKMASNEFLFQKVLGECDRDLQTQYMSLLYRFASAIAKADGNVDEKEEKWLAEIMKSQESNFGNGSDVRTATKQEQETIESPYETLNDLIGMSSVKEEITKLANFIKIQQVRESKGLKTPDISYHCVFTGNPGTGKTTVARIMASIYKDLGILKKGHLVETDRSGLVAEYVGQTAVKTNRIIDSALDGVLFIDEAYSLVNAAKEDFGQEAISTLLKRMEDDRNRLVVILAGYGSEMITFIDSNPGLQSRFNRYIHFPDYSAEELKQIFLLNANKNQYTLNEESLEKLDEIMSYAIEHKDKNFGNARFVRNLFEKSIQNQAMRLSSQTNITEEILSKLEAGDLPIL